MGRDYGLDLGGGTLGPSEGQALREQVVAGVFTHYIRQELDAARLGNRVHAAHVTERKDMSVILQGNHAPILHLVIPTDDTAYVQAPNAILRSLVITQLAERDTQLGGPTGIQVKRRIFRKSLINKKAVN